MILLVLPTLVIYKITAGDLGLTNLGHLQIQRNNQAEELKNDRGQ